MQNNKNYISRDIACNVPTLILLIVLVFCFYDGNAQTKVQKDTQLGFELDKLLSGSFRADGPGCGALVAVKGQIIYQKAFGLADTKLKIPLTNEMAFKNGKSPLGSYKIFKEESTRLASSGYKLPDGSAVKTINGIDINYGSRSTIPILTLRRSSTSDGYYRKVIYAPVDDIYIEVYTSTENTISTDPTQTIFNKVLTDQFSSIGFKDYDGSRLVFYHFLLTVKVMPQGGIIEKGKTARAYINGDVRNLHFTLDGSEPTIKSPLYSKEILLNKACTLKIKTIASANSDTLKSVSYVFAEGTAPEPVKDISGLKPGLKYSYYEGLWSSLPDFSKLTPKVTGIAKIPDYSVALRNDSCALQFIGFVYIEKDDMYNIYIVSDDGSKVFLNDKLIINSDGAHGTVAESFVMPLKKGYYPIKVLYFENGGGQELQVGYWTEGNEPRPFTKDMLFYSEN